MSQRHRSLRIEPNQPLLGTCRFIIQIEINRWKLIDDGSDNGRVEEAAGLAENYLLPPDLFVEQLDRALLERVMKRMLTKGEMKSEWLCISDEPA